MRLRPGRRRHKQRGVTAVAVILTVAILAIMSHGLVQQALLDYRQGARVRDTIALQQLTDSALEQALYYLSHDDRKAAAKSLNEPFGVARIEITEEAGGLLLRVVASAPNAERPRLSSRVVFRLKRTNAGPWRVVSAKHEAIPMEKQK